MYLLIKKLVKYIRITGKSLHILPRDNLPLCLSVSADSLERLLTQLSYFSSRLSRLLTDYWSVINRRSGQVENRRSRPSAF